MDGEIFAIEARERKLLYIDEMIDRLMGHNEVKIWNCG